MNSKIGGEQVNTFSGGMSPDIDVSIIPQSKYIDAKNIRIENPGMGSSGAITPIEDITKVDGVSFAGVSVIGSCKVRNMSIVATINKEDNVFSMRRLSIVDGSIVDVEVISCAADFSSDWIQMVSVYENDSKIMVYWTDGENQIRSVNVSDSSIAYNLGIADINIFNIIPPSNLNTPSIDSIGVGSLKTGRICYLYQLSNSTGSSTAVSQSSVMVDLTGSNGDGGVVVDGSGSYSGKSVRIKIKINDIEIYKNIKLYSIYYSESGTTPVVSLILDSKFSVDSNGDFFFIDNGSSVLSEYTLDEFGSLSSNYFSAKSIDQKDSMLFAGNINSIEYNIDNYDTRAYQYKKIPYSIYPENPTYVDYHIGTRLSDSSIIITGGDSSVIGRYVISVLKSGVTYDVRSLGIFVSDFISSSGILYLSLDLPSEVFPIGSYDYIRIANVDVDFTPEKYVTRIHDRSGSYEDVEFSDVASIDPEHDCIHSEIYSNDKYSDLEYIYDNNGHLGGAGANVSYKFANTWLIGSRSGGRVNSEGKYESSSEFLIDKRIPRIGSNKQTISHINIALSDGNLYQKDINEIGISEHEGRLDYSNELLASALSSYKRDEIYRFGAVFHSEDGRKTPVKWIADIRFPAGYIENSVWNSFAFDTMEEISIAIDGSIEKNELLVKPLGVEFEFKNIPTDLGISKIEIVRSRRDINNRTILLQGAMQKTGTFSKTFENEDSIEYYYDTKGYGTLRPHPVMSMGYNYAIVPMMTLTNADYYAGRIDNMPHPDYNDSTGNRYQALGFGGYSDIMAPSTGSVLTSHSYSISPYKSNRNVFMLINPEASYYGGDFVEPIIERAIDSKIVIQNIISPMSTPTFSDIDSGDIAVGHYQQKLMRFIGNGGLVWPTTIFMGADLNDELVSYAGDTSNSLRFFPYLGLCGSIKNAIDAPSSASIEKIVDNGGVDILSISNYDVRPIDSYDDYTEQFAKTFISPIGSIISNDPGNYLLYLTNARYRNGIYGYVQTETDTLTSSDLPWSISDNAVKGKDYVSSGYGSVVYKYYSLFRSRSESDSDSVTVVNQTGMYVDDITYSTISSVNNVGSLDSIRINNMELADDIKSLTSHSDSTEYTQIGNNNFLNWSKPLTRYSAGALNTEYYITSRPGIMGQHGAGILIDVEDQGVPSIGFVNSNKKIYNEQLDICEFDNYSLYKNYKMIDKICSAGLSTYIVDVKSMTESIYGGSSYSNRQFSEYISTGYSLSADNGYKSIVFGGDTFISMFDYTITRATDPVLKTYNGDQFADESKLDMVMQSQVSRIGAIIPIETSINTMMDSGETFVDSKNVLIQKEIGTYSIVASAGIDKSIYQGKKEFDYSSGHSSDNYAVGFVSDINYDFESDKYDCRVLASEKKTNGETYDSWSIFKSANYIDVDSSLGEITRLVCAVNKLFFIQENAIGILSVNDRSLISDNSGSELSLGTGGVLSRFDYITKSNGVPVDETRGVMSNGGNLFVVDSKRSSILKINDSIENISLSKGVSGLMINNKTNTNPIGYNSKYSEILIKI